MKESIFSLRQVLCKGVRLSAIAAFALYGMTACSEKDILSENLEAPEVEGIGVNAVTDQSVLSSRVHNYKSRTLSRAGELPDVFADVSKMPSYDEVQAAAKAAAEATYADYNTGYGLVNLWGGGDVCITGDSNDVQIGATNKKIYVSGEITITNTWGSNYSLYVLKGGKVTYANGGNISASQANIVVYNYGTIVGDNGVISVYNGTKLYNAGEAVLDCSEIIVNGAATIWDGSANVTIPSSLYVAGDLEDIVLKPEKGCLVNIGGNLLCVGKDLEFDGDVRVGGILRADNLSIINGCHFYSDCGVFCSEDFTINSNGSSAQMTYLKANNVYQCAGSSINLPNKGMIEVENIYQNLNNGNDAKIKLTEAGFAVIKAKEMHWNAGDPLTNVYLFSTPVSGSQIVTDCEKYARLDNSLNPVYYEFDEFEFLGATVKRIESDEERTMTIEKAETCANYEYNPKPTPPDDDPIIDIVADIDHDHDISATCLQYYNGKIYASYHQRGAAQHGCLEVFETTDDLTSILQYVEDENNELDFNHLIIDNNRLYTVGNHVKKGGILAWIGLAANGLMDTEAKNTEAGTAQPLNLVTLKAQAKGDGNCIVRDGDYYQVMSTTGFETYDAATLARTSVVETPGKAKHVCISNGKIYATYLTEQATDEDQAIDVKMRQFNAGAAALDNPLFDVNAGTIQPNNGKNVVAVDPTNGNIFVCLGRDGLRCLDANGNEKWTYQPAKVQTASGNYKAFCNGVAVDDNYIYVAYGTFGLIILDKEGNQLAQSKSQKSANYVTLADGYVYVAYGRERIRVYKFYPEGITSYDTEY